LGRLPRGIDSSGLWLPAHRLIVGHRGHSVDVIIFFPFTLHVEQYQVKVPPIMWLLHA
jgi:hypothetical protein